VTDAAGRSVGSAFGAIRIDRLTLLWSLKLDAMQREPGMSSPAKITSVTGRWGRISTNSIDRG
jgi:hypothetical protein